MEQYFRKFIRDNNWYQVQGIPLEDGDNTIYAVILQKKVSTSYKNVASKTFPDASVVTEQDIEAFVESYFAGL